MNPTHTLIVAALAASLLSLTGCAVPAPAQKPIASAPASNPRVIERDLSGTARRLAP